MSITVKLFSQGWHTGKPLNQDLTFVEGKDYGVLLGKFLCITESGTLTICNFQRCSKYPKAGWHPGFWDDDGSDKILLWRHLPKVPNLTKEQIDEIKAETEELELYRVNNNEW